MRVTVRVFRYKGALEAKRKSDERGGAKGRGQLSTAQVIIYLMSTDSCHCISGEECMAVACLYAAEEGQPTTGSFYLFKEKV